MTMAMMQKVLATGDNKGSALKELCLYYGITNYDIAAVSDQMAEEWLRGNGLSDCAQH